MIQADQFNVMFKRLASNQWKFFPEKERLKETETMYYDRLKNYDARLVHRVFGNYLRDKEQLYLPTIQRIVADIEAVLLQKAYKTTKPYTTTDRRLHRLFRRMVRQARYVIKLHGNDKMRLRARGLKYEKLRIRLQRI